ncbi:SCO family protein [Bradyrhizobium sp. INPA01-394B]|uniref:SCO family protein n=2 Tax=Bradyrhizobium campsiandrae TaxID=1729892 RepID=A0ABR7U3B8_9BRAD|nr:SCO family protein [Bradyrhizobium campsiandrae]MBC9978519.1 SCO family protein [Bradyrhizobium campsiandrae]
MVGRRGLAVLVAGCLAASVGLAADKQPSAAQMMDDLMYGRGQIGGPFSLVDHTGKSRDDREFRGKLLIVYFGYTFCPDVCPGDLQAITLALDQLGSLASEVQPIFITIDPERDDKVLAQYVSAFHPSLIGLTGTPDQIREVANSYKAFYTKVRDERTGDYAIDHAGVIYLMGRDGKYLGFMPPQTAPDRLAEVLRTHLAK